MTQALTIQTILFQALNKKKLSTLKEATKVYPKQ